MNERTVHKNAETPFILLLFLTFLMFALLLAGTGSVIYKKSAESLDANYTSRTAVAYVSEKVRQHDSSGDIFLTQVEGITALGLRELTDEEPYLTYIYYYDGALRELFTRESTPVSADMGNKITELTSFSIEETATVSSGKLMTVEATGSSSYTSRIQIHVKSCEPKETPQTK